MEMIKKKLLKLLFHSKNVGFEPNETDTHAFKVGIMTTVLVFWPLLVFVRTSTTHLQTS